MSSYEKINYSLRPAKAIERKMLCEAFRCLTPFATVQSYRYVGFGSPYFSDFALFHKNLISIEKDIENEERFDFNKPFNCIKMEFGSSTEVLPTLDWDTRSIVWLDYDGSLNDDGLADIRLLASECISGSLIIVSVNAHPDRSPGLSALELIQFRKDRLVNQVGEDKIPIEVDGSHLGGWGKAKVLKRIIDNEIVDTLNERNGARDLGSKILYRPLFNFNYSDGAKMLTVGGILYEEGQAHILPSCSFERLPYVVSADEEYKIEVPMLTYKELRHLNEQLPRNGEDTLEAPAVPEEDVLKYEGVYRYFPNFAETNL